MPDYTVRDSIERLTAVNETGVTNLADKGVTIESPVTTAKIMDGIGDIEQGGGGVPDGYSITFVNSDEIAYFISVAQGDNINAELPVPTGETGYFFAGWCSAADGSGDYLTLPHTPVANETWYATYLQAGATLNDQSWARISAISAAGTASSIFSVGDTKTITLNGAIGTGLTLANFICKVFIIGFDHNSAVEGNAGRITFGTFQDENNNYIGLCDSYYDTAHSDGTLCFNMFHSYKTSYSYGGYRNTDLRYDILGSVDTLHAQFAKPTAKITPVANTLMAALPSDLRAVLQPVTKFQDNYGQVSGSVNQAFNVFATTEYLPLLSEFELFGTRTYANQYEQNYQSHYAFFDSNAKRVRSTQSGVGNSFWWTRSCSTVSDGGIIYLLADGSAPYKSNRVSYYSNGLAPIFVV